VKWFILIAMVFITGCRPDITCRDSGCAAGFLCDQETGECVTKINDCRTVDLCRTSEVCDTSSGLCRPQALLCADGNPCPLGLICNARSGFCEPAFRCSIDGCPPSEICNSSTERCLPRPCSADPECPDGFVCEDVCILGCRPGLDSCGPGESCLVQTGDTNGTCQPRCREDRNCPFGQFCDQSTEVASCKIEPPCSTDSECREDEVCRASSCIQPPCFEDQQCLEDQICEIPTGTCISGACDEDIYGSGLTLPPNHYFENAARLPPAVECPSAPTPRCVYEDLSLCPGRSDWFVTRMNSSEILRIRVDQLTQEPDIDLYVYDENRTEIARNTLLSATSTVRVDAARTQDIFIEIRPTTYQPSRYALTLAREFCDNDLFEENDTMETATTLNTSVGVISEIRATACGLDEDWFRFPQLDRNSGFRIERVMSETSLLMELYTPDGRIESVLRGQELDYLRLGVSGDYFLRVLSGLGLSSDYRFIYNVKAPWECPGVGTAGAWESAENLSLGISVGTLCPTSSAWEVDWWLLENPLSDIRLAISPTEGTPTLDIVLLATDSELPPLPVRSAAFTGSSWELVVPADANKTYYMRVSSSTSQSPLLSPPQYEIRYESGP